MESIERETFILVKRKPEPYRPGHIFRYLPLCHDMRPNTKNKILPICQLI